MIKLSKTYVELEVIPKFKEYFVNKEKKFTYDNVAHELGGIAKSTVSRIVKEHFVSEDNLNAMYSVFSIQEYKDWDKTHNIQTWALDQIAEGYWVSYRFNSKRHLNISSWLFDKKDGNLIVWKKAPKGYSFRGEFTLDDNYCLSGVLSQGVLFLNYNTILPLQEANEYLEYSNKSIDLSSFEKFNWLVLNLLVKHGEEVYSTVEVLHKQNLSKNPRHNSSFIKSKSMAHISPILDNNFLPTNPEYLAYNYLTHYNSKSRVPIAKGDDKIEKLLNYHHSIRIACPIRSIDEKNEFIRISSIASNLKDLLKNKFKFKEDNIYFEITKYRGFKDIDYGTNYLFERRQSINHTHFIALIPKSINSSSAVFAEIFYRIGRKLPIVIFYEDENSLTAMLSNLKNNNKIINTKFYKCDLKDVINKLEKDEGYLFKYELI